MGFSSAAASFGKTAGKIDQITSTWKLKYSAKHEVPNLSIWYPEHGIFLADIWMFLIEYMLSLAKWLTSILQYLNVWIADKMYFRLNRPFYLPERDLDRASKSDKFWKEGESTTSVPNENIASCGMKLLFRSRSTFERSYGRPLCAGWLSNCLAFMQASLTDLLALFLVNFIHF